MDNEQFWKMYVGDLAPVEFCRWRKGRPIVEYVEQYVARLPHFYGITLRGMWRETFASAQQWRRDDVCAGIIGYLEAHREEWENAVYAPEPPPVPQAAAQEAVPPATQDSAEINPPQPGEEPVDSVEPSPENGDPISGSTP